MFDDTRLISILKKIASFLDVNLNLNNEEHKPYSNPNNTINFVNKESNYSPQTINNILKFISISITLDEDVLRLMVVVEVPVAVVVAMVLLMAVAVVVAVPVAIAAVVLVVVVVAVTSSMVAR